MILFSSQFTPRDSESLSSPQRARFLRGVWFCALLLGQLHLAPATRAHAAEPVTRVRVQVDRGADLGQSFGTLFEAATADRSLVIGAGFANQYNTRLRGDRHAVQLFIRPAKPLRELTVEELPRPNTLCGTYLVARDEQLYSTFGGLTRWNPHEHAWTSEPEIGGTQEAQRVGDGLLEFGESTVRYNGTSLLEPPAVGKFERFFYALGRLCFYHIHRNDLPYRPFQSEEDGFSRLYACPWQPGEPAVDLSRAETLRLPVVGETTFAWGQLGDRIVTGSNIGGFYEWRGGAWRLTREPTLGVSFQLYSSLAWGDRMLLGQYPTGRLFELAGTELRDLPGWPPVPPEVSASVREAQTTVLYGGELFVGVWPWGELWRYHPDRREWNLARRMFTHPPLSNQVLHPYDAENQGNAVKNQWGQRVASLVTVGDSLFVSTSAKDPCEWRPEAEPFLAPDKWQSYGAVHQVRMPGHLQAATRWTDGPTTLEFELRGAEVRLLQDGRELARSTLEGELADLLRQRGPLTQVTWKQGLYGAFGGRSLSGTIE